MTMTKAQAEEHARDLMSWAQVDPEINAIVGASVGGMPLSNYVRKNGVLLWARHPGKNVSRDN